MKPRKRFLGKPKRFWAHVRTLSQHLHYTEADKVKVPTVAEMRDALQALGLTGKSVATGRKATVLGKELRAYFVHRATVLHATAKPSLMDAAKAKKLFMRLKQRLNPSCPLPMNKQKGSKKAHAFLTGLVNMLIEAHTKGMKCDYNPMELTTITGGGAPLRTLARRVDGAFPSPVNPVAVWEIKEYYYTTTFGSRVADGVYESLLDGMELEELRDETDIDVKHYLMVDAYLTWWKQGRPYLCRIVDMLHMGYVDEVLFGKEVVKRLPILVRQWVKVARERDRVAKARKAKAPRESRTTLV